MQLLADTSDEILRSKELELSLERLLSSMRDAETGQRGYLLTGSDAYLFPYDAALRGAVLGTVPILVWLAIGKRRRRELVGKLDPRNPAGVALIIGLALSIALMGFAASFVARLLHKYRWIAYVGLLIILYVAINMLLGGAVQQFPDHFAFLTPWFGPDGH